MLYNVSAEFADSLDRRPLAGPGAERGVFLDPGRGAGLGADHRRGREDGGPRGREAVLPHVPVLANTGVKHATVAEVLRIADGCVVGSALKVGGDTWKPVDPERARDFMDAGAGRERRDA